MSSYPPAIWTPLTPPLLMPLVTTADLPKSPSTILSNTNTKFDPDAGRDTSTCTIPPYQKSAFEPTAEMCEEGTVSLESLSSKELNQLAYEYAPYLFFHPLEKYFIENVNATFDDPKHGKIWKYDQISKGPLEPFTDELHQTDLLRTARQKNISMHSRMYFFEHDLETPSDYLNGANFSEPEGNARKSTAPIYFNVFENGTAWVFNYFFYYTFNGIANMVSLSSYEGKESYTSFTLSPFGVHEGDWEGMSVMVCRSKTASQPLAVTYQQHGWQQTTDCTAGECTFFKETIHPVGFSALNSHATYATSTENMVYTTVEVPFFVNLQGVLIVDRTAYLAADNTYRVFEPSKTNIIQLQNPEDVDFNKTNENDYWQGFGGQWGNSTKPVILPELGICLNANQTEAIDCPTEEEDPIFGLVMQLMGVYPPSDALITQAASEIGQILLPLVSETGKGPTGPMMKNHWRRWMSPNNAPLWKSINSTTTAEDFCAKLVDIPDTGRLPVQTSDFDFGKNLIIVIIIVLVLLVLTIVGLWLGSKKMRMLLEFDEDTGEVLKPGRPIWFQVHAPSIMYTFWLTVVVIGAIMFGFSIFDMMDLLEFYVPGIDWHAIGIFLLVLGCFIMFINLILCVLIWLPSQTLWKKLMQKYHHCRGEEEEAEVYKKDACNISFIVLHKCFLIGFSLLFISLMLTAVVVVVGVGVVGFAAAFSEICHATIGSINGVCLDLSFFSIEQISCGPDFQEFCNQWAGSTQLVGLWGAILICIGHYYLVAAAGACYHQQNYTVPMLDMLPSRDSYLWNIETLNNAVEPDDESSKEPDDVSSKEPVDESFTSNPSDIDAEDVE